MPSVALNLGLNELEFFVNNTIGGNYQGFRAEFNTTVVPTPAVLPGLIGMGIAACRKRRSEAQAEASEES